ncbi:hypothetical protein ABAC460_14565 [Asticcacaulis sp. AC460]|uniref:sensor histidine kinase n=1 Tax=Asticcacaulis sp. AC460 TaxID=1282360 RepID=UPI0003C3FD8E|nr:ATP-binding protein [Asticcacaulis sp. AC460]ESQ89000.1 hypothetical protein ABAC460_14565 [Asticcacaulis sp. AC460]
MASLGARLSDLVVRLKRRRKLLLIALAVLLPVFVLSGVVVHDSASEIAFAEKELSGTAYLRRTWNVVSVCDAWLVPARSSFGGRGRGETIPKLEAEGSRILADLSNGTAACGKARAFLRQIADETNLTLDPRSDTYYLMHAAVTDLPGLSSHAADLARRDRGASADAVQGDISRIAESAQAVEDSLNRAIQHDDGSLTAALALPSVTLSRAVSRYVSNTSGVVASPAAAGEMRGALDNLWVVSVDQLERLLNLRIAQARLKLWVSMVAAVLLSAGALVGLIYYDLYVEREEVMTLNASLKQSNEELERFAYICSHDMQEPVRMMNIYAAMLLEDSREQLDEIGRRHLDYIAANARAMKQMIQDILEFCRVGRDPVELSEVDCNVVLEHVLEGLSPAIAAASARVVADRLPVVTATPTVIQAVLQNLIGNAVKFRHGDTRPDIRVSARPEGHVWRFEVRDNGIGIDEAYREEVFAVFRRLNRRDDYPGHGLGLSTCRKLLQMIGGTIDFTSKPGQGSVFYFTVPMLQRPHGPA